MEKPIVSVAGLRGIADETFTPEIILPYIVAFADSLTKKKVVVGGDSRPSREWAQPCVESALRARGVDVISVGLVPTPTIGILVREYNAGGGIAITASHNPIEWNGLKFFNKEGVFLNPKQHEKLQELIKSPSKAKSVTRVGKFEKVSDAFRIHLDKLLTALPPKTKGKRKLRVVIDCCNSSSSMLAPILAAKYGVTPEIIFNNPGRPFPRGAEPLPENIKMLGREVKRCKADFGVAIDPDADRLAIVDETGRAIGEERTLVLCTDAYFKLKGKTSDLVVNLSTSQAMDDLAERHGVNVYRTPIGEAHVHAEMKKREATIGGEGNGGVIVPEIHPGRDAATALALIILEMQGRRSPLSKWNQSVPDYIMVKTKIEVGRLSFKQTIKRAKNLFKKNAIAFDETDGLKTIYENSFIHIRPSSTEPIIRIFVEAPDKLTAKQLLKETQAILT